MIKAMGDNAISINVNYKLLNEISLNQYSPSSKFQL